MGADIRELGISPGAGALPNPAGFSTRQARLFPSRCRGQPAHRRAGTEDADAVAVQCGEHTLDSPGA
ncbi:hypothetical protein P7H22_18040 [Paenibacillus larvae]|nr:hypothetical protein [Paenibacillus larvae]MDT2241847.1 hypothetical protein [Paenibacillus larvae]